MNTVTPCGGCGEADPDKRCLGCLHVFRPGEWPDEQKANLEFFADAVYETMAGDLRQGYWTREKVYVVELLGKGLGKPTSIVERKPSAKLVFEQDWIEKNLDREDRGAALIYHFDPAGDDAAFVRFQSYDESLTHETFKKFEGKRLRVTVEVIE